MKFPCILGNKVALPKETQRKFRFFNIALLSTFSFNFQRFTATAQRLFCSPVFSIQINFSPSVSVLQSRTLILLHQGKKVLSLTLFLRNHTFNKNLSFWCSRCFHLSGYLFSYKSFTLSTLESRIIAFQTVH